MKTQPHTEERAADVLPVVQREEHREDTEERVPVDAQWAQVLPSCRGLHRNNTTSHKPVRVPGLRDARGAWTSCGEVGLFEAGQVEADPGLRPVGGPAGEYPGARRREIVTRHTHTLRAVLAVPKSAATGAEPVEVRIHPLTGREDYGDRAELEARIARATDAEIEAWAGGGWDVPCGERAQRLLAAEAPVRVGRRSVLARVVAETDRAVLVGWRATIGNTMGYEQATDASGAPVLPVDLAKEVAWAASSGTLRLGRTFTPVLEAAIVARLRELEVAEREAAAAARQARKAAAKANRPAPAWTPAPLEPAAGPAAR